MLKYVRIAVTAISLTVCMLLSALWVQSYWWVDAVYVAQTYSAGCMQGDVYVMPGIYNSTPAQVVTHDVGPIRTRSIWNSDGKTVLKIDGRAAPIWTLFASIAAFAIFPLATLALQPSHLIIAMTLVAVVLGIISAVR